MKKTIIIISIALLLITLVLINNQKRYIKYDNNTLIAVYLGNTSSNTYPSKTSNYVFDSSRSNCNNGASISWDEEDWGPIINTTKSYTKCDIYFKILYKDNTGANIPELHQAMIPIKFDGTTMKTADISTDSWYDYGTHAWANAALIKYSDTTIRNKYFNSDESVKTNVTIDVNDLLQMYVWIPRYRYKLWNATMGTSTPQAIEIEFESKDKTKSSGSTNGEWLTHPAFTFGETELNGIWVGKFETSGSEALPTILPNQVSLTNINVSKMFYSLYNMSSTTYGINKSATDTHVMKNMEWGAVAYLSHSIYGRYIDNSSCISSGCEVWINNINTGYGNLTQQNSNQPQIGPSITGCAGITVNAQQNANKTACESGYDWTTNGVNASTTGNIYGIYDMSGGTSEYVMGVMYASDNSTPLLKESGFTTSTLPEEKYYETYNYYDPNATSGAGYLSVEEAYARYHLGDATRETLTRFQSYTGSSWYGDFNYLIDFNNPWIYRGASSIAGGAAGLFDYPYITGGPASAATFRAVISKP